MHDLAIDLGTHHTRLYVRGRGIAVEEPSVVTVRRGTEGTEVVAVGREALEMLGRTPEHIRAVRPIQDGVIADFKLAEVLLKTTIQTALRNRPLRKPRVVVASPYGITEVERRAFHESLRSAGAREIALVAKPIAAALGASLPIDEALGNLVVDIGAGTTEVGLLSLGGLVAHTSVRVAGIRLDQAIVQMVKERHGLLIGDRTAERTKVEFGAARPGLGGSASLKGRDVQTGIPRETRLTSDEIAEALSDAVQAILGAIRNVMDKATPELASDVLQNGMVLCGGSAWLRGLSDRMREETGLPVLTVEDPQRCSIIGAGRLLEEPGLLAQYTH